MAWYRVAYRPQVVSDLAGIETITAQRLLDKTKWLASNAENLRHEPLAPDLPVLAKYAVGEWRIWAGSSIRSACGMPGRFRTTTI